MKYILEILHKFEFDFWTYWGMAAQGFFFLRLIIQWFRSEKAKRTIIPSSFWWLGLIGASMLLIYALIRNDIVFIITAILQIIIYSRNFVIALNHNHGFAQNDNKLE